MVLGQARITDEGVAQLKSRIGSYFKGEYVWTPNYVMTKQAIAHWCDGMGDYNNKLYRDEEYAKKTKYGSIIAPPISFKQYFQHHRHESRGFTGGAFLPFRLGLAVAETGQSQRTDNLDVPAGGYRGKEE